MGTAQLFLSVFALFKVIPNLELSHPGTDGGKDATDERGRTNRPFDQGNVAHGSARTNHHLRGRRARSTTGQNDNREVGPGGLDSDAITQLFDNFIVQRLFRDYGRARTAVHAAGNVSRILNHLHRNSRMLQDLGHQHRVLAKSSENVDPAIGLVQAMHGRSVFLCAPKEAGRASEDSLKIIQRSPHVNSVRTKPEFADGAFVSSSPPFDGRDRLTNLAMRLEVPEKQNIVR